MDIYEILRGTGISHRRETVFSDNYSRLFTIFTHGAVVAINVRGGDMSLLPEKTTFLGGDYIFNLNAETVAGATEAQINEIKRWVGRRAIPGLGALLYDDTKAYI